MLCQRPIRFSIAARCSAKSLNTSDCSSGGSFRTRISTILSWFLATKKSPKCATVMTENATAFHENGNPIKIQVRTAARMMPKGVIIWFLTVLIVNHPSAMDL